MTEGARPDAPGPGARALRLLSRVDRTEILLLGIALAIPLVDLALEGIGAGDWRIGNEVAQRVFTFAIMALGLNIVVGYTGLLHLGVAAFMAIGVYSFGILTCNVYPFQIGFWGGLVAASLIGAAAGVLLGSPTLRLRGDYLAIVTLGFGEIIQDVLKNVESVTKGIVGINPLPAPGVPGLVFASDTYLPWYFLYLAILILVVILSRHLENSRLGRQWMSIREDELAASCMGINPTKTKLMAFAIGAGICALAGVLWASKLETTGEPSTYDFNVSITILVIAIVGGVGSLRGVLAGAGIVMGFDIALKKITEAIQRGEPELSTNVFLTPSSWKFLLFGLALVVMMRFRPEGIFPSGRIREELHEESAPGGGP